MSSNNTQFILASIIQNLKFYSYNVGSILIVFSVISVMVNVLIVIVYVKSNSLRKVQDILLTILSAVSIYIALSTFLYVAYLIFPEYVITTKVPCLLFANLIQGGIMSSSFILLLLGLERYFFIIRPFSVLEVPMKKICLLCASAFFVFTLSSLIPVIGFNNWESYKMCLRSVFPKFHFILMKSINLLSVAVTSFCHIWVLKVALKHSRQISSQEQTVMRLSGNSAGLKKNPYYPDTMYTRPYKERKAIVTCGSILFGYLVCYLPHYTMSIVTLHSKMAETWRQAFQCLLIMNSLVSPLIYARSNGRFINRAKVIFLNKRDQHAFQFQRPSNEETQNTGNCF